MVLSLAKLHKVIAKLLERIGANMEPCSTPDKMFWNALKKMLFILTFCFRSLSTN